MKMTDEQYLGLFDTPLACVAKLRAEVSRLRELTKTRLKEKQDWQSKAAHFEIDLYAAQDERDEKHTRWMEERARADLATRELQDLKFRFAVLLEGGDWQALVLRADEKRYHLAKNGDRFSWSEV